MVVFCAIEDAQDFEWWYEGEIKPKVEQGNLWAINVHVGKEGTNTDFRKKFNIKIYEVDDQTNAKLLDLKGNDKMGSIPSEAIPIITSIWVLKTHN